MSDRFFLDTNVFVYAFDHSNARKRRKAGELIEKAASSGRGAVSFQVVQEFLNVALRRFESPLTEADAHLYLAAVLKPMLVVHSSYALYAQALRIRERYRMGWYDSLIVGAAAQAQCGVLYTEELQNGAIIEGVRVVNPFPQSGVQ